MRKTSIKVSVVMAAMAMQLAGCAGGESNSGSLPSAEAVSQQDQPSEAENPSAAEQVLISRVGLELEVKPEDTPDMVSRIKEITASHGGIVKYLSTSMYETEDSSEEDGEDGGEEEISERDREDGAANEDGEAENKAESTEPESDGYGDDDDSYYDDDDDSYYDDDDDSYYDDDDDSYYDDDYYYDYYYGKYGKYCQHWTSVKLMIPDDQADEAVRQLSEGSKVLEREDSMEDYTVWYQGMLSRIAVLEDEEQRLIRLLEDARSSGKALTTDDDSDFLEKMMNLENHLWSVRKELNGCRYGDEDDYLYRYYYDYSGYSEVNLGEFEYRKGKTVIEIDIYVNEEED